MSRPRKPPKDTFVIQVDANISPILVAKALIAEGISIHMNLETQQFYAVQGEKRVANVVPLVRKDNA